MPRARASLLEVVYIGGVGRLVGYWVWVII